MSLEKITIILQDPWLWNKYISLILLMPSMTESCNRWFLAMFPSPGMWASLRLSWRQPCATSDLIALSFLALASMSLFPFIDGCIFKFHAVSTEISWDHQSPSSPPWVNSVSVHGPYSFAVLTFLGPFEWKFWGMAMTISKCFSFFFSSPSYYYYYFQRFNPSSKISISPPHSKNIKIFPQFFSAREKVMWSFSTLNWGVLAKREGRQGRLEARDGGHPVVEGWLEMQWVWRGRGRTCVWVDVRICVLWLRPCIIWASTLLSRCLHRSVIWLRPLLSCLFLSPPWVLNFRCLFWVQNAAKWLKF